MRNSVIHISYLPYFTIDQEKRAGMPSLTKCVQEFARRGWETAFVYPSLKHARPYQEDGIKFFPVYFPFYYRPTSLNFLRQKILYVSPLLYILMFPLKIQPLFPHLSPRLIYAHGAPAVVIGGLFRQLYKIPLIARLYGISGPDFILNDKIFSFRRMYWQLPEILAFKTRANLYVVTDDGTRGEEVLTKFGLKKQGIVLMNGVDVPEHLLDSSRDELRKRLGFKPQEVVIAFVGRLEGWKHPDRIINVAHAAHQHKYPWLFLLIGDGKDRVMLEKKVKVSKLEQTVQFWGAINHEKIWEVLYAADVFLTLPDLSSLSNALLEAIAVGTPVVCNNKGAGIDKIVIEGLSGYLVNNPDNPEEVIEKIEKALQLSRQGILSFVKIDSWRDRLEREFTRIQSLFKK